MAISCKRPARLSVSFVERVSEPGRYSDGRGACGLSLLVKRTADGRLSKVYTQRLVIHGKPTSLGLGRHPVVTLDRARAKALDNARTLERGDDPRVGRSVPTCAEAAEAVIEQRQGGWKNPAKQARSWCSTLAYAWPRIGDMAVHQVTAADLIAVIEPLWTAKPSVGRELRTRLSVVFDWCISRGYRADNPTKPLAAALGPQGCATEHRAAIAHGELRAVWGRIGEADVQVSARLALQLVALTGVRSNEAAGAQWPEIDWQARTWTIPAERMKAGQEHRVPLSAAALGVLSAARGHHDAHVFPATRSSGHITDSAVNKARAMAGVGGTVHGLRSTFMDWAAEQGIDQDIAEMCLAHKRTGVTAAYLRSDVFDARREVMQRWGAYITGTDSGADAEGPQR